MRATALPDESAKTDRSGRKFRMRKIEHVIGGDVIVEAEIIEQPRRCLLNPHHRRFSSKSAGFRKSRQRPSGND
jgi:hypothetical protein